jgi:hypothetical protein
MSPAAETVWQDSENKRFFVVRNGEMRIHYSPDLESNIVIRYTDQLEGIGVKTDADLERFTALGEEMFSWVNNSWFEVWDSNDTDYFSDPIFELDSAIEYAKTLHAQFGEMNIVV